MQIFFSWQSRHLNEYVYSTNILFVLRLLKWTHTLNLTGSFSTNKVSIEEMAFRHHVAGVDNHLFTIELTVVFIYKKNLNEGYL